MAINNLLNLGVTPLPITQGGTGHNAVTVAPTASSWAGWDANKNLSANSFIAGYATTVTAAAYTILLASSAQQQFFTGSTTQSVAMPVESTLVNGQSYEIVNQSSDNVTVQSSNLSAIRVMAPNTTLRLTVIDKTLITPSAWYAEYIDAGGSGTVSSGNINEVSYYAATGNTVSGLTTANNGLLVTSDTGVPSIGNAIGADIQIQGANFGLGSSNDSSNIVIGTAAGSALGAGSNQDVIIGSQAGANLSTASASNVLVGFYAGNALTSGSSGNVFIGSNTGTGLTNDSINNIIIGDGAGASLTTATGGIIIGTNTYNFGTTIQASDTVVGNGSMRASGGSNTVFGGQSLTFSTASSNSNSAFGFSTLSALTTGAFNVGLGAYVGGTLFGGANVVTSSYGIFLGYSATVDNDTTAVGAIAIGTAAIAASPSGIIGQGISIGSSSFPVGADSGSKYFTTSTTAGYWRPTLNGQPFFIPLLAADTPTKNAVIVTDNNGTPKLLANGTAGYVLTANSGAPPSWQLGGSGGGLTWATIAGTTQNAAVNHGYVVGNASATTITLPTTFAVGDVVAIKGFGAAGWVLNAGTGKVINIGQSPTSSGGSVTSAGNFDVIYISGLVANTSWSMDSSVTFGFTVV